MEIDRDKLRENFATKSDEELLDLYAVGTLTEIAYDVLEQELAGRGVTSPHALKPQSPRKKDHNH